MSVYKFFENDFLFFSKFFEFWWRCSDNDDINVKFGCFYIWLNFVCFIKEEFLDNGKFVKSGIFFIKVDVLREISI